LVATFPPRVLTVEIASQAVRRVLEGADLISVGPLSTAAEIAAVKLIIKIALKFVAAGLQLANNSIYLSARVSARVPSLALGTYLGRDANGCKSNEHRCEKHSLYLISFHSFTPLSFAISALKRVTDPFISESGNSAVA
jgi:hypothetical protein